MADTSDFITGCDGSEAGGCPPGCISEDSCPPGYSLQCVADIPYPEVPPGVGVCSVTTSDSKGILDIKKIHDEDLWLIVHTDGNNPPNYSPTLVVDSDLNTIDTLDTYDGSTNNSLIGFTSTPNYIIHFCIDLGTTGCTSLTVYDRATKVKTINQFIADQTIIAPIDVSYHNGKIAVGCEQFEIGNVWYAGSIPVYNILGEYMFKVGVDRANNNQYPCTHAEWVEGNLWTMDIGHNNQLIKVYDEFGTFLLDITLPAGLSHILDYGQIYEEHSCPGRITYLEDMGSGARVVINGWYNNLVYLYDTSGNYIATMTSPSPTGGFGRMTAKYGNYIAVTERNWDSNSGGVHIFDNNGVFLDTILYSGGSTPDHYYGRGLFFNDKYVMTYSGDSLSSISLSNTKTCQLGYFAQ